MIYLSTGGFHSLTGINAVKEFAKKNITEVELSGVTPNKNQ